MKNILIVYSGFDPKGSTATLANFLANGVKNAGLNPILKNLTSDTVTIEIVSNADGFLLGSGDYNGNPEPSMIDFLDNVLKAGNQEKLVKIQTSPFGVFCTSAGYATGAQEVLNSMARAMMTFGGVYVGGSSWREGQGYAAMVVDSKDGKSWSWKDGDPSKYACDYGFRVATMASFLAEQYATNAKGKPECKESFRLPGTNKNGNVLFYILLSVAVILFGLGLWVSQNRGKVISLGLIILGSVFLIYSFVCSSSSKTTPPKKEYKCSNDSDCPDKLTCVKNKCVLDQNVKKDITDYVNAVYPNKENETASDLNDLELYNFFMVLCYYWVSYHNSVSGILAYVDPNFPKNVQCGGYYSRGNSNVDVCGSDPHTNIATNWPCSQRGGSQGCPPGKRCCKEGTLSFPPAMNQLYFCDYIQKDVEVLRNGYDYTDLLNKSILYDPIYLYKKNKLNVKNPIQNLCLLKDGVDGTGKNLSYKLCDQSKTYDATKIGPGYNSNSLNECTRDHGIGGSPDIFYYICAGTGNFLNIGVTLRALNKIHAALLIIRRAGELNFGSFTTYRTPGQFTKTKTKVTLKDSTISNSFTQAPQLLLLEYFDMLPNSYTYTMNCPSKTPEFATAQAKKVAPKVDWPFKPGGSGWGANSPIPRSAWQISYTYILNWFFLMRETPLPSVSDYNNNWANWNSNEVKILGEFFDAVTVPYFDDWQLNYALNRLAAAAFVDVLVYQFVNPGKVEIKGYSEDVNPKDSKGNPWGGITNSDGKYLDTLSLSIQPGGGGGWAYELTDYRLSIKNAASNPAASIAYWTQYANQFIQVGNPLSSKGFEPCTPVFCKNAGADCDPTGDDSPGDWKIMMCNSPVPVPPSTIFKCNTNDYTCSKDPSGNYSSKALCETNCKAPSPPPGVTQCKDIAQGAEHNYCSGWCNHPQVWNNCGVNTMNDGNQCNCAGCSGCKPSV